MKIRKLIMDENIHFIGLLSLTFSTIVIALDYGATFTGYIDFFLGNLIAYSFFILFSVSFAVEVAAIVKNRPKIWVVVLVITTILICSFFMLAFFPAFLAGRVGTPI